MILPDLNLLLCSNDADFTRFPDLNWTNPLLGGWKPSKRQVYLSTDLSQQ